MSVVKAGMKRAGSIGWYRNPARSTQESLGVAYTMDGGFSILRPDFVFFSEESGGHVVADIVDPHGTFLADALPKLRGLATYAEEHADVYRRIEAVDEIDGNLLVLDMTDPGVRRAIFDFDGDSASSLYGSDIAQDYSCE
jgi:hypothetical protein